MAAVEVWFSGAGACFDGSDVGDSETDFPAQRDALYTGSVLFLAAGCSLGECVRLDFTSGGFSFAGTGFSVYLLHG